MRVYMWGRENEFRSNPLEFGIGLKKITWNLDKKITDELLIRNNKK